MNRLKRISVPKNEVQKEPEISEGLVYVGLMTDAVEGLHFRNQSGFDA